MTCSFEAYSDLLWYRQWSETGDLTHICPFFKSLIAGVNLWKLEQRPNVGSMLLRLNFNTDVAPRLLFLKEIGVEGSSFGYIITHNPFILTESLENLQARWHEEISEILPCSCMCFKTVFNNVLFFFLQRVNYLKSKKFSSETVASMVSKAPYLLNFSVKRLDNRLGFFQHQLSLSASNVSIFHWCRKGMFES